MCFDVASRPSFEHVASWVADIHKNARGDVDVVLCGCKCDLPEASRQVTAAEAEALATKSVRARGARRALSSRRRADEADPPSLPPAPPPGARLRRYATRYFEASAKQNVNVSEMFLALATTIKRHAKACGRRGRGRRARRRRPQGPRRGTSKCAGARAHARACSVRDARARARAHSARPRAERVRRTRSRARAGHRARRARAGVAASSRSRAERVVEALRGGGALRGSSWRSGGTSRDGAAVSSSSRTCARYQGGTRARAVSDIRTRPARERARARKRKGRERGRRPALVREHVAHRPVAQRRDVLELAAAVEVLARVLALRAQVLREAADELAALREVVLVAVVAVARARVEEQVAREKLKHLRAERARQAAEERGAPRRETPHARCTRATTCRPTCRSPRRR